MPNNIDMVECQLDMHKTFLIMFMLYEQDVFNLYK